MRRLDRDVSAASNGPWPGPLPSTHRATWRALVAGIQGRVSCAPCVTSCPEPSESVLAPRGQARAGAPPPSSGRDRLRRASSVTLQGSLPPSPCRRGGPRDSERRPCRATCQSAYGATCRSTCRSAATSRTRCVCSCISSETGAARLLLREPTAGSTRQPCRACPMPDRAKRPIHGPAPGGSDRTQACRPDTPATPDSLRAAEESEDAVPADCGRQRLGTGGQRRGRVRRGCADVEGLVGTRPGLILQCGGIEFGHRLTVFRTACPPPTRPDLHRADAKGEDLLVNAGCRLPWPESKYIAEPGVGLGAAVRQPYPVLGFIGSLLGRGPQATLTRPTDPSGWLTSRTSRQRPDTPA